MNNLPSNMRRHTVFRDNPYSHTVVFEDNYPLPAEGDIKMQVRYGTRVLDVNPEISVTGQRVTYTYTPEMLAKLPEIVQQYLVLDGSSFIGGELGAKIGYGEQEISETHVTVADGEVTVVQVMGLALVTEQVSIATDAAEQASADRIQTGQDRQEVASDREAVEAARDQVIGPLATKMDLYKTATFAAMEAFIADENPNECMFLVLADETYGGIPRFHGYTKLPDSPIVQLVSYTS